MPGRRITRVKISRAGDLNHAEGLKDLGLFSTVPDSTFQGKLLPSAFQNASNTPKVQAVRNPHDQHARVLWFQLEYSCPQHSQLAT